MQLAIIRAADKHVVVVERECIEHLLRLVCDGPQMVTTGLTPKAYLVGRGRGKAALRVVVHHGPDALFVMRQRSSSQASPYVPEANHLVVRPGDDLRLVCLAYDGLDGVTMTTQHVNASFGAHIPEASSGISTAGNQQVQLGMQSQGVHGTEMTVELADHFVLLEVPTLHHLVFATREQVRMTI